ncbi:MAG TPA: glycosyltransferase family 87 protein [Candidatus Dormibacteraeota bacterium]|nr:glycosyltransferase family 87 protein [Candidatus Dormibacteraeota bacterium]
MAGDRGAPIAGRATNLFLARGWLRFAFAFVAGALGLDALHREDWRLAVDFHTYFAAAVIGIRDGWSHLYDQDVIAIEQKDLVPGLWSQPYLSPPPVALLTAPLTTLPFWAAFVLWAAILFGTLALTFAWASTSRGLGRWTVVVGALSPFWVMHAVRVGQVVPLVAAAVVVAWRLLREDRDVAAGLVLAAVVLKPNTAFLVPLALLVAGRQRAFVAWLGATAAVVVIMALTLGPYAMTAYASQLLSQLPPSGDHLTLHGALGVQGGMALALRLVIVVGVLATANRLRGSTDLLLPIAVLGSLLVAPYLHTSDLCLLSAAGFMVWEARPTVAWRAPLAVVWVLASPFLYETGHAPGVNRWPWFEIALLLVVLGGACGPLTAWADSRRRAPA